MVAVAIVIKRLEIKLSREFYKETVTIVKKRR